MTLSMIPISSLTSKELTDEAESAMFNRPAHYARGHIAEELNRRLQELDTRRDVARQREQRDALHRQINAAEGPTRSADGPTGVVGPSHGTVESVIDPDSRTAGELFGDWLDEGQPLARDAGFYIRSITLVPYDERKARQRWEDEGGAVTQAMAEGVAGPRP